MTLTAIGPVCDELGQASRTHTHAEPPRRLVVALPLLVDASHPVPPPPSRDDQRQRQPRPRAARRKPSTSSSAPPTRRSCGQSPNSTTTGSPTCPAPWYWSAEADWNADDSSDVVLHWLSLTQHPAQTGMLPLTLLPGDLHYRGAEKRWTAGSSSTATGAASANARPKRASTASAARSSSPSQSDLSDRDLDLDRLNAAERYMLLTEQADAIAEGDDAWMHEAWLEYRPGRHPLRPLRRSTRARGRGPWFFCAQVGRE